MKRMSAIIISAGVALAAGAAVFHTSLETKRLEATLALIESQIDQEQALIDVLVAEWAYVNQPDRLRALADDYLPVGPVAGHQVIADVTDVPLMLPLSAGQPHPLSARFPAPPRRPGSGPPPEAPRVLPDADSFIVADGVDAFVPALGPAGLAHWQPPLPNRRPLGLRPAPRSPSVSAAAPAIGGTDLPPTAAAPTEDPISVLLATFQPQSAGPTAGGGRP